MPDARTAVIGAFILGGLAIIVAAILVFGGGEAFAPKVAAVTYFEGSVDGLAPGAAVTFRGVRVGSVSKVGLVLDPATMRARIPVRMKLEPDRVTLVSGSTGSPMLRGLIESGLRAKLEAESLVTGQMQVDLDMRPDIPARLIGEADEGIPEIPSMPSDLQELRDQLAHAPLAETVAQTKRTMAAVERLADRIDASLDPLIGDARQTLQSTSRTMDAAGIAVSVLQQNADGTLGDFRRLVADAREQLEARGQEVSHLLSSADKAAQATRDLAQNANTLVARGSRPRDDLEATLRDLSSSASTLRDLLQATDRDPSIVLRGRAAR
jgi:paraquat-inducible protein B